MNERASEQSNILHEVVKASRLSKQIKGKEKEKGKEKKKKKKILSALMQFFVLSGTPKPAWKKYQTHINVMASYFLGVVVIITV